MTNGDMILAWQQRQEYLANQAFDSDKSYIDENNLIAQDAHVTEEERWDELCPQQK
jgi:hypothetical protein